MESKPSLSRLRFEDLKFPFGGLGTQIPTGTWPRGSMQLSAAEPEAVLTGQHARRGPSHIDQQTHVCIHRTP